MFFFFNANKSKNKVKKYEELTTQQPYEKNKPMSEKKKNQKDAVNYNANMYNAIPFCKYIKAKATLTSKETSTGRGRRNHQRNKKLKIKIKKKEKEGQNIMRRLNMTNTPPSKRVVR